MTRFVSTLTLCLFDCLAEAITTLFVFSHVFSRSAMIKYSGTCFQFCTNTAINPRFLVREGFNSHSGNNISYTLPDNLSHRVSIQWGKQVFDTLPILQVFLLTKHVEVCNFQL